MTYLDNKFRNLIAGAALFLSCASPHLAMAQSVNSLPDGPAACDAFQRGGYGSWTALRPTTIFPNGVPLSLGGGQTFAPGQMFHGFEVTAVLDRSCGNREKLGPV
jgi:hypothetical protein